MILYTGWETWSDVKSMELVQEGGETDTHERWMRDWRLWRVGKRLVLCYFLARGFSSILFRCQWLSLLLRRYCCIFLPRYCCCCCCHGESHWETWCSSASAEWSRSRWWGPLAVIVVSEAPDGGARKLHEDPGVVFSAAVALTTCVLSFVLVSLTLYVNTRSSLLFLVEKSGNKCCCGAMWSLWVVEGGRLIFFVSALSRC